MNSTTTKWLVGAALGLFAYILLIERHSPDSDQRASQAAKLFPTFNATKVTSIEIVRTNQSIRVEQVNDRWRLTTPFYPAQSTGIEGLLQSVSQIQQHAYIPPEDLAKQPGWQASFGFAPPRATVTVQEGTNRIQFHVGSKTLMSDQLYLQLFGDKGLHVVDSAFIEHLPDSATEWRHPMLVHSERLSFDRLAVTNGTRVFEIQRESTNQIWRLTKPLPAARANFNSVDYLIKQLWNTRISQFVTDDPKADLEPYGLQSPEVELTLAQGTNPVFQIQFGKISTNDPTQVYARRLSHTNIVLAPLELVEILRKPHTEFRDRTLLSFDRAAVDRIEVQAPRERFAFQRQTNGVWSIVEPFQADADSQIMQEFLDTLGKLEIEKFEKDLVTDFSLYGLSPPARQYVLKSAVTNAAGVTNQIIAQVDFSTNRVNTVFARRLGETSVYGVSYVDTLRLPHQGAYQVRDRRIWSFASSNVTSLTIMQRGQSLPLTRNAARGWSTNLVENEAVEEALHRLGQLRAIDWTGRGEDNLKLLGFRDSAHKLALVVNTGGKSQTLTVEFGNPAPKGNRYAVVRLEGGEPIIFQFPGTLYQHLAQYLSLPPVASTP